MPQASSALAPLAWMPETYDTASPRAFIAALVLAILLHVFLLYTVHFDLPDPTAGLRTTRPLEIIVLRDAAPTDQVPEEADAFAQVNREGGGSEQERDSRERERAEPVAEPIPPSSLDLLGEIKAPIPSPEPIATPEPLPQGMDDFVLSATLEEETPEAPQPVSEPAPSPEENKQRPPAVTPAQILASRTLEITQLAARIAEKTTAYANRPRRRAISASTREYKYAAYLEAWRRKVERIGNLNYPEEAKKHKLYGSLILNVAVRADGGLESVRVLRSSGFDILDEAAVNIVKLAAPFAPFPPDIQSETDILDITRTWQFLSSNRLGWEN